MKYRISCTALMPLAVAASGVHASAPQKIVWPSTLASVEGKWYAERSEAAIEIVGDKVYLKRASEPAKRLYNNPGPANVIAILNNDFLPKGDSYTMFTATCNERGSSRKCGGSVNYPIVMRKMNLKAVVKMNISIGDSDRYYRYEDLDPDQKAVHKSPI